MPKSFGQMDSVQISTKVPVKILSILRKRAEDRGMPQSEVVRETIEAVLMFFGLPDRQVELLRADMKREGKDEAAYVRELLAKRYEELLLEQAKGSRK